VFSIAIIEFGWSELAPGSQYWGFVKDPIYGYIRLTDIELVEVTDYERERRATNVVASCHRKVIGCAGNTRVRRELEKNGADFIEIEESELIRGSGGPRCMTAPLSRDLV